MPGRIVAMAHESATEAPDLRKDRSHAQENNVGRHDYNHPGLVATDSPMINGPSTALQHGALPNGMSTVNGGSSTANGDHVETTAALVAPGHPPHLDQEWRSTPSYKSLGKLMDRMAQQCYFDLTDTLNKMSEIGGNTNVSGQANGASSHSMHFDNSTLSLEKKRLLLNFAHDQRDRFTKTLVLSDWSRNADDMSKFVDMKVWLDKQRWATTNAAKAIGEAKRNMIPFKVPAPDIEGAMELLATGRARWAPDLNYIPPKRLTAKQLLKMLRDMNVTLATRVRLHEEIPQLMRDVTIGDGRATFRVPGEFEVDLSVASEDPATPFYFIDIRFLFSPSSNFVTDQLRAHLENRINHQLAAKGLQGCYDFLHNFVLTHKINVLRSQATDLIRNGKWTDCIKLEHMRRSLVVQYWASMPGPKNWLEIGVSSGKQLHSARRNLTPTLSVRWFRKGREVLDERLDIDWNNLDLERYLLTAIGKHCFGKLASLKEGIDALEPASKAFCNELRGDEATPEDCSLTFSLPSMRSPLVVHMEPTTGQFSISPANHATARCERIMNLDPTADVPGMIASVASQITLSHIRKLSEQIGWTRLRLAGPQMTPRSVFAPKGWNKNWVLGVNVNLLGMMWWIGQVEGQSNGLFDLRTTTPLNSPEDSSCNLQTLQTMEKIAVAAVDLTVLALEATANRLPLWIPRSAVQKADKELGPQSHSQLQPLPEAAASVITIQTTEARGVPVFPAVYARLKELMRDSRTNPSLKWPGDVVRISHHGMDISKGIVRHDLRLVLQPGKLVALRESLKQSREPDIRINNAGGLAVVLRTRFGDGYLNDILARLRNVWNMDKRLTTLKRMTFITTHVDLSRLDFTYSDAGLSAHLSFASNGGLPVQLRLEPSTTNPHQRVRTMLEQELNKDKPDVFFNFAYALSFTLPLLKTFERLEDTDPGISVRVRSATWFNIQYKTPACAFDIRVRQRATGYQTEIVWHMYMSTKSTDQSQTTMPEGLIEAVKNLWASSNDDWRGIMNGLVAKPEGIGPALERLDEILSRFKIRGDGVGCDGSRVATENNVIEID